tara:strand:+ start:1981 stop:3816 length:1836 start_codon:yes stop_codon:yes gene_type:complete
MKSLSYLNKYLVKYKFRLILGIFFVVISNVFGIYPAQIIREAFDAVAQSDELKKLVDVSEVIDQNQDTEVSFFTYFTEGMDLTQALLFFAGLVILMALLKGIFTFFTRQTIIIMSRLIEYDLKNEVYQHYQDLSMSFYKKNNTGDIMNRISEDVTRVRMYLGPGIMYSINLVTLFVMVISVMLSIDVELTLYALAPLPILSILIYYISNKINSKSEVVQRHLSGLSTFSQESFSGIRIIKSFVKEKYMNEKLDEEAETYKDKNLDLVRLEAFFFPVMMMLIGLSTILTVYIGGLKTINGEISIGNIAEFIIYVNMLTWPVTALGWVTSLTQRAAASQERINEFLQTTSDIQNVANPLQRDIKGKISFKKVGFTYPESGTRALQDVSFEVNPGETLAIIGRTGSGKSTIADLICRLFDATDGEVQMDDENIKQLDLNQLRSNIGYVPQEVFLFSESIKNNIAFGIKEEVSDEEVIQAAKQAAIHDSIATFPKQYDTELGERGITLSGGQKQRISIARAIINRPNILIFDDCLSAVDTETEEKILSELKKIMSHKTAVIISHRISSVQHADQILVMEEGQIVERGNHESLVNQKGIYFETFQKQLLEDQKSVA